VIAMAVKNGGVRGRRELNSSLENYEELAGNEAD